MSEHMGAEAPEHAKNALSHKIGPLPLGVWALAIIGGVGVAVLVRRNANDQATQDAANTIDQATGSGWDQADPGGTTPGVGGVTTGPGDGSYPESGGGTTPPGPDTTSATYFARHATSNTDWQRWSVEAMRPLGFDTGRTSAVLSAYLAGAKLDATGTAVLGAVMARCGPPPHPPKHKADPGPPPHPRDPDPHLTAHPAPASDPKDHGHGGAGHHGPGMPGNGGHHPHHSTTWQPWQPPRKKNR